MPLPECVCITKTLHSNMSFRMPSRRRGRYLAEISQSVWISRQNIQPVIQENHRSGVRSGVFSPWRSENTVHGEGCSPTASCLLRTPEIINTTQMKTQEVTGHRARLHTTHRDRLLIPSLQLALGAQSHTDGHQVPPADNRRRTFQGRPKERVTGAPTRSALCSLIKRPRGWGGPEGRTRPLLRTQWGTPVWGFPHPECPEPGGHSLPGSGRAGCRGGLVCLQAKGQSLLVWTWEHSPLCSCGHRPGGPRSADWEGEWGCVPWDLHVDLRLNKPAVSLTPALFFLL